VLIGHTTPSGKIRWTWWFGQDSEKVVIGVDPTGVSVLSNETNARFQWRMFTNPKDAPPALVLASLHLAIAQVKSLELGPPATAAWSGSSRRWTARRTWPTRHRQALGLGRGRCARCPSPTHWPPWAARRASRSAPRRAGRPKAEAALAGG